MIGGSVVTPALTSGESQSGVTCRELKSVLESLLLNLR